MTTHAPAFANVTDTLNGVNLIAPPPTVPVFSPANRPELLSVSPDKRCMLCCGDTPASPSNDVFDGLERVHPAQYGTLDCREHPQTNAKNTYTNTAWRYSTKDNLDVVLQSHYEIPICAWFGTVGHALLQIYAADPCSTVWNRLVTRDWDELKEIITLSTEQWCSFSGQLRYPISARLVMAFLARYREVNGLCMSCIGRIFLEQMHLFVDYNPDIHDMLANFEINRWSGGVFGNPSDAFSTYAACLPDYLFYAQSLRMHCCLIAKFAPLLQIVSFDEGFSTSSLAVLKSIRTTRNPVHEYLLFDSSREHHPSDILLEDEYKLLFSVCWLSHPENFGIRYMLDDRRRNTLVPGWMTTISEAHSHIENALVLYINDPNDLENYRQLKYSLQYYFYTHLSQAYELDEEVCELHGITRDWIKLWDGSYGGQSFQHGIFPNILSKYAELAMEATFKRASDWPIHPLEGSYGSSITTASVSYSFCPPPPASPELFPEQEEGPYSQPREEKKEEADDWYDDRTCCVPEVEETTHRMAKLDLEEVDMDLTADSPFVIRMEDIHLGTAIETILDGASIPEYLILASMGVFFPERK